MMRLNPILLAVAALVSMCVTAYAAEMQGASDAQRDLYLAGAGQGVTLTNLQSMIDGGAIFCPPADYVLNVSEMKRLADSALSGEHAPAVFVMAALEGLKQEFPC
jgi:hypothetical protein